MASEKVLPSSLSSFQKDLTQKKRSNGYNIRTKEDMLIIINSDLTQDMRKWLHRYCSVMILLVENTNFFFLSKMICYYGFTATWKYRYPTLIWKKIYFPNQSRLLDCGS